MKRPTTAPESAERRIEVWEKASSYCGSAIDNAEIAIVKIAGFMEVKNLYQLLWCTKPTPKRATDPKLNAPPTAGQPTPGLLNKHRLSPNNKGTEPPEPKSSTPPMTPKNPAHPMMSSAPPSFTKSTPFINR